MFFEQPRPLRPSNPSPEDSVEYSHEERLAAYEKILHISMHDGRKQALEAFISKEKELLRPYVIQSALLIRAERALYALLHQKPKTSSFLPININDKLTDEDNIYPSPKSVSEDADDVDIESSNEVSQRM